MSEKNRKTFLLLLTAILQETAINYKPIVFLFYLIAFHRGMGGDDRRPIIKSPSHKFISFFETGLMAVA